MYQARTKRNAKERSTRRHDRLELSRVDILLEAQELAIPKAQNVTHLSIDALAGRLVGAGVAAFHHDMFAGVVERADGDREAFPLRTEPHEELLEHRLRPDPSRAIRLVGIALCFSPFDLRMEPGQYGRDVTERERGINILRGLNIGHHELLSS